MSKLKLLINSIKGGYIIFVDSGKNGGVGRKCIFVASALQPRKSVVKKKKH